jgi:two-component system, NtrC family, sensor histidine kinase HydH
VNASAVLTWVGGRDPLSWLSQPPMAEFDAAAFESIKQYVEFDERTAELLAEFHPIAAPHFVPIVADFYATIEAHPQARSVITGGKEQIERLKGSLVAWLESVLLGPHDAAYLESHARIGRIHVRIALPQEFMFTAMNRIRSRLIEIVHRDVPGEIEHRIAVARAVNQILDLELAIMLDTYRENYVEKARAAERLATIGQLAASVGHELRNPLGIIDSSLYLIRQRMTRQGIDDAQLVKHWDKITAQVKHCSKTINSLLDLARDRPPSRRPELLKPLIERALEVSALPPGVDVELAIADDLKLYADPDDLVHVISNLLVNGAQAQGETGRIEVTAAPFKGGVEIRVRDHGPGVPAEIRERIFDALFTTKARGTGLGLALCRRIIYGHGGELRLEPTDRGACFRVWLPDARSDAEAPMTRSNPESPG